MEQCIRCLYIWLRGVHSGTFTSFQPSCLFPGIPLSAPSSDCVAVCVSYPTAHCWSIADICFVLAETLWKVAGKRPALRCLIRATLIPSCPCLHTPETNGNGLPCLQAAVLREPKCCLEVSRRSRRYLSSIKKLHSILRTKFGRRCLG